MTSEPSIDAEAFKKFEREGYSRVAQGYDKATAMVTSQVNDAVLDAVGGRPSRRAAHEVRVGHQSQDRESTGAHHPADADAAGGPSHRVARASSWEMSAEGRLVELGITLRQLRPGEASGQPPLRGRARTGARGWRALRAKSALI
jgi:hypothetical protein